MNTYEPTLTKQNSLEDLLRSIAKMTSTKRDIEKINNSAEVSDNTMYTRLKSLFQKLFVVTSKSMNTSDYKWVISPPIFTKLGERLVNMKFDCSSQQVTLEYIDPTDSESVINGTPIFSLKVTPKKLILNPFNISLSSHDIDMAIYEIEQIVEKEYEVTMNDLSRHHKKEEQLFWGNTK